MPRLRATPVVALCALLAAACGDRLSPEERIARAAEATLDEGSAAFSVEMQVEMDQRGSGMNMTMTGDGVADLAEGTGRMDVNSPGLGSSMTMIFDGDAVYVRLPTFMSGGRSRWVRRSTGGGGVGMGSAGGLGQNPLSMIDALDAVEGEITSLGSDTVAGTDVQGYEFTISGAKIWGDSADVPARLRELEIPSEVWLDDGNRVRKMVMDIDLGPVMQAVQERATDTLSDEEAGALGRMLGGMEGTMTMTAELRDFGTEVTVQVPDSTEVIEADALRGRMGGGGGAGAGRDTAGADPDG